MKDRNEFLHKDPSGIKQEITVVVELQDGKIKKIHNTYCYQPAIHFKGGSIKWHEDLSVK